MHTFAKDFRSGIEKDPEGKWVMVIKHSSNRSITMVINHDFAIEYFDLPEDVAKNLGLILEDWATSRCLQNQQQVLPAKNKTDSSNNG